jgi:hypothetical protein
MHAAHVRGVTSSKPVPQIEMVNHVARIIAHCGSGLSFALPYDSSKIRFAGDPRKSMAIQVVSSTDRWDLRITQSACGISNRYRRTLRGWSNAS